VLVGPKHLFNNVMSADALTAILMILTGFLLLSRFTKKYVQVDEE